MTGTFFAPLLMHAVYTNRGQSLSTGECTDVRRGKPTAVRGERSEPRAAAHTREAARETINHAW